MKLRQVESTTAETTTATPIADRAKEGFFTGATISCVSSAVGGIFFKYFNPLLAPLVWATTGLVGGAAAAGQTALKRGERKFYEYTQQAEEKIDEIVATFRQNVNSCRNTFETNVNNSTTRFNEAVNSCRNTLETNMNNSSARLQEAIETFIANTGRSQTRIETAVERFCTAVARRGTTCFKVGITAGSAFTSVCIMRMVDGSSGSRCTELQTRDLTMYNTVYCEATQVAFAVSALAIIILVSQMTLVVIYNVPIRENTL